jgi:ribosomal protein L11 methyltransferase
MAAVVPGKHMIDIGSGSGILSLAACAMGASIVEGIDIDPAALAHAYENSLLNGMEKHTSFVLPEDYAISEGGAPQVVLMNMIQCEQRQAWNSLSMLHASVKSTITSGILAEGRKLYLEMTKIWGWTLVDEVEEDGWLAFHFIFQGA